VLGGVVLVAAGVFQWTTLKHACLRNCRSPIAFIMTSWRDGVRGALRMGLDHGAYCLGCCWLLMAVLFVAGVMNLLWVAAIAVFVLAEKIVPRGDLLARAAGVVLVGAGAALLAGAVRG
jgi:predicted metal-binding membrane protein